MARSIVPFQIIKNDSQRIHVAFESFGAKFNEHFLLVHSKIDAECVAIPKEEAIALANLILQLFPDK